MESDGDIDGESKWSRNAKEARTSYHSQISQSYVDPMPEYISPELLILIAQNAPSELDVFKRSLKHSGKVPASTPSSSLEWQERRGWIKTAKEADCKKKFGVQVLLSSGNERNHNPKQFTMDARRSCPEVMIWSDYDTEDSRAHRVKNVKRKRPKSLDLCKPGFRSIGSPISASSPRDERKDYDVRATADVVLSFPKSVDFTSPGVDQRPEESRPASAPAISASIYESDTLNTKPWRYGMKKKRISAELKPAETVSCKRKAEIDPKKQSEVKKYMETKFAQLRKERHIEKSRAEAALAARKEKQRKLDVECQALLKSQAADINSKQKSFSRPPWTSEYVTLAETFRPWSRASTGDLPPPKDPRNQEPVPLDLYTSISTYEAAEKSLFGEGCDKPTSNVGMKTRTRKLKTREGEKQLQGKNVKSDMYEMTFPPTHPYHALHLHPQTGTHKKTPLATKARWKSKGKSLKRFNPEKIYQLQVPLKYASQKCVDLMAYGRTERTSRTPHGGSLCRDTRAARMQTCSKSSSQDGYTTVLQQDDCYAVSALKKHEREVCTRSKVKRLKPTYAPTAEHITLPQFELKPKYSRVRPVKWGHVAVDVKELSLQDIAKVMKSKLSPNSSRETVHETRDFVSPGTIHSRKCSRHVSLSPRKHLRDQAVLQVLKPTKTELPSPHKSLRNEDKSQVYITRQESLSPDKRLTDGGIMQVLRPQRKDTRNVDTEISKDVTRAIRRQRMDMLRSLAEQLVKRVDAACAEQLLQNIPNTVLGPTFDSHVDVNNEPFNQPVGLYCLDEPFQVEPKFYYHCTQPDNHYHGHLSELEQAGCEIVELPKKERMSEVIPSVNDLIKDPFTVDTARLNVFQGSAISPHDWNVTDKGMSMSDNIPSGCSSYGPSSPSTDSSSPVILPTGAKYNIRRIKRNKNVEEQARKRQKEAWTLPAEEDIHSVINLYTQRWLSKEKKKSRSRCELTDIGQGERGENTCSRSRSRQPFHEHAPEKHKFKFGAAPTCSELEMSEPCIRSLESNCCTSTKFGDSSGLHTQVTESDHRVACIMQESIVDHINVAETPSPLDKSVATIAVAAMTEENIQKKKSAGNTSQRKPGPEGMVVQIGDLKLCQSPTSFHLRLDIHKDDHQLKKPSTDLGAVTPSKMETTAADANTPLGGSSESCQSQTFKVPITPMNITYARRLRTRTTPDGASTNDERIVVEFDVINRKGGEPARQNCSEEIDPSGSSTSETSREILRVNMIEVQNLDDPNNNPHVQKDAHESKDGSGALIRSNVLQPRTHVTSSNISMVVAQVNHAAAKEKFQKMVSERTSSKSENNEADTLTSLNSPVEQSEEKLDLRPADALDSVGEKGYSNLLNTTEHCEGRLDRLLTKMPDFHGMSTCSKMNTELASHEAGNCWEKGEDQQRKESRMTSSTAPSTYSRFSIYSAEQRLELVSESKLEVQPDLQQNSDNTREWQLKSRRDHLEAELQKLDAEIRKTRAKLQANHSVFDTKTRKCKRSVVAVDKLSPALSEYNYSSKVGGILSDALISARLSNHPLSSCTLPDSPRQRTPALSSKAAGSALFRTLDKTLGSPIHSNSFVSEDIQMEEEIFSARTLEMVPDTVGERYGKHYELQCREPKFMNENFEHWEAKSKPICQHDQPANEVSEEELVDCRTMSTQDEAVDEGPENSTGRVPSKRFDRASKMQGREATIPPALTKLKGSSSPVLDDQIINPPYQELQPASMEEENEGILSTVAVKTNPISEPGEGSTYNVEAMNGETLSSASLDMEAETGSKNRDLREDRLSRCSHVTSTHNRRELNHAPSRENESGSRIAISLRQSSTLADKLHDPANANSTMNMREGGRDAQRYVAGVHSSLQLGNSPIQRRTMVTSVSNIDMLLKQISTSSPVRKQWQVDTVEEDLLSSSVDGAKSSVLKPKRPELEEVVEDSSSTSRDGIEGNSKTCEIAVDTVVNLNRLPAATAEISEGMKVLPSSSSGGRLQGTKSRACVNAANPPFHRTPQQPSEISTSFSSIKGGKGTILFSGGDTSTVFDDPQTPQQIGKGTPLELREQVASRENSEGLTVTRDDLNDAVQKTFPPNLEEENCATISFQDNGFSSSESGTMRRLRRLHSEVPQILIKDSKEQSIEQLLRQEITSLRTSEEDKSKLVTNLPLPDLNLENSDVFVPRIRPGRLRQHQQEQVTFEVIGSICLQQGPRCSIPMAEGTIIDGGLEVISASSNARIEGSRNPSILPHSGPPLSQSCAHSTDIAPVRSQWSLHDPGSVVTMDQTDLDQSTDSSTEFENQFVTSVAKQQLCPPLTKKRHESPCAGTNDGIECDLQTSEKRRMEHRERLVRLCQENDRNCTPGLPTFFQHKTTVSTVPEKSSEVGNLPSNLLETSITDESSSTAVPEMIDNFITARGDAFCRSSHRKQICQGFRLMKPSPSMSKNKVGYQELARIDGDVTESRQKPLPPVLLSHTSKPVEIAERRLTNNVAGEHLQANSLTSRDQQETHIPCSFGAVMYDEQSPVLADIQITMRAEISSNCIPPRYGQEGTGELITSTRAEEMTDMPSGIQGSTPVTNIDLSRSLPRQPLNLFASLYGKGEGDPFSNSEGFAVSEELENFDLDENLENDMDAGITPELVKVEQLLEPSSPHLSDTCRNISGTSCPLGQEVPDMSLRVAVCHLGTDSNTENLDVYLENQGEHGLTTSSNEAELIARSFSPSENIKVQDCSAVPLVSQMDLETHRRNISTMRIPPEDDDGDIVESNNPTSAGTENYKFEGTEDSSADIKCESDTDLDNFEQTQEDADAMLTGLSRTWMRSIDTNQPTLSSGMENEFEQSTSSGGCNLSRYIVRDTTNSMDLGHDIVVAAELGDLAAGQYSKRVSSGALINTLAPYSFGRSPTTVVKNNDNHDMASGTVQEQAGVVSNSHIGRASEELQVPRPYSSACGKAQTPCHAELGVPKPLLFQHIKPSEHEESLMREVYNSKPSGCSRRLGEEDCLSVPKTEFGNPNLENESSWSEDKGTSGEPQNISTESADGSFHGKEVDLERHVLTPSPIDVELSRPMSESSTPWLPGEAHRLVECLLSSGSELIDRASEVSKAFSSCSVVTSCPGILPSMECSDQTMLGTPLQAPNEEEDSPSFAGLPSKFVSSSSATKTADQRHQVLPCEPEEAENPEFSNRSRPDEIITLLSSIRQSGNLTLDRKSVVLDRRNIGDPTEQDLSSRFGTLSRHDKISAQESTAQRSFLSRDSFRRYKNTLVPLEYVTKEDMRSCCEQGKTSTEMELSEFRGLCINPQLATALAISLQIPEVGESREGSDYTDCGCTAHNHDDKCCLSRENSIVKRAFKDDPMDYPQPNVIESHKISAVYSEGTLAFGEEKAQFINLDKTQEAEIQDNKEQSLCRLPTEDTSTATCHDQDSICSIAGSGESQNLDGTLEDIKMQTPANTAGKLNMMADTLTDMLFETLLAEGLSDLTCTSRSLSRASSTETNQTPTVSNTLKTKIKSRSNKGFMGVLKHFLPVGWRAASLKHKTGLFLQVEGLRPHQLSLASGKSLSVSGNEGHSGTFQNTYPSPDDFEQSSLVHRKTTETAILLLTSKEYVQSYVQQTLELSRLLTDPSPSTWYDSKIPVGEDIYRRVMETQHSNRFGVLKPGDQQVHNKLLSDLVNESLIKYSATFHQSPSILSFSVDGGNVVQFVTSRIVEHGSSASKLGPDIDKVVGKLLEDEHWEKCYEEARDLISDLAQAILCDLIDRFVQEMIQGRNNTSSRFTMSVYRSAGTC